MTILKTIQLCLPRAPCSQEAVKEQILYPQCIHDIEQTGATVDQILSTLVGRMSANITIPDIPHLCFSYYKDKKTVVQREQTSFVFFLLLLETNCSLFFQGHSLFIENYYKEVEGHFHIYWEVILSLKGLWALVLFLLLWNRKLQTNKTLIFSTLRSFLLCVS